LHLSILNYLWYHSAGVKKRYDSLFSPLSEGKFIVYTNNEHTTPQ